MTFADLGLSTKVLKAVTAAGYENPTPIQEQAIPFAVQGKDVLGIAQTGTGKTAGFVLPMLTRLEKGRARARMPRSLILTPTRELAAQVAESFETYGAEHKLSMALLIGGVSFDEQSRKLDKGVDILIATPGRLLDHFKRGKLLLTAVEILVIDEADRMLDMGFIPDIEDICKLLPFTRQTLFFSATMPPEIQRLVDNFLHLPARVEVAPPSTTAKTITQKFKMASSDPRAKREQLREVIGSLEDLTNAIVFCNRKRDVEIVFRSLKKHGFNVGALHGDMDQFSRTKTLQAFRDGKITMLAASDVAARGLDIPEVSHVLNYDVPIHAEDYVHRIGRTGRAGRKGAAFTLVTADDAKAIKAIETLIGEELSWLDGGPDASDVERRPARGGRRRSDNTSRSGSRQKSRGAGRADDTEAKPARSKSRSTTRKAASNKAEKSDDRKRRRGRGKRDEPVIGMGDHVPAFLTRPVR